MNAKKVCDCGWALDPWGECGSCRVRKLAKLPKLAKCETCKDWRVNMRCEHFGPNSVCRVWKPSGVWLRQGDRVVPRSGDVDQGIPVSAARAQEEASAIINIRRDGSEQNREVAAPACPHGADGTTCVRGNFDGGKDAS